MEMFSQYSEEKQKVTTALDYRNKASEPEKTNSTQSYVEKGMNNHYAGFHHKKLTKQY